MSVLKQGNKCGIKPLNSQKTHFFYFKKDELN